MMRDRQQTDPVICQCIVQKKPVKTNIGYLGIIIQLVIF